MIEYYNYLTTPSGNSFNIKELTNKNYLILLKFLNGENFKGFYEALDILISDSIPNFKTLDICDKAYIYIAYYYYSIRSTISIKSDKFDSVEVPLTIMLDSIEEQYIKEHKIIEISGREINLHYPRTLLFDDNNQILVDTMSGINMIQSLDIPVERIPELRKAMPIKLINDIEYEIKKAFSLDVHIVKDVMGAADIKENILEKTVKTKKSKVEILELDSTKMNKLMAIFMREVEKSIKYV